MIRKLWAPFLLVAAVLFGLWHSVNRPPRVDDSVRRARRVTSEGIVPDRQDQAPDVDVGSIPDTADSDPSESEHQPPVDFEDQERDIDWAPAMEAELYHAIADVRNQVGASIEVECRTTRCRVTLLFPPNFDIESLRSTLFGDYFRALSASLGQIGGLNADAVSTTIENSIPTQIHSFVRNDANDGYWDLLAPALVESGFTEERAEWIRRREMELDIEARVVAAAPERNGMPLTAAELSARGLTLRSELSDAEYERYLRAADRYTGARINVRDGSPAELTGLQTGDGIISYDGKRVFEFGDLAPLTQKGPPGELVTVEVLRDGQVIQFTVPRGQIGIMRYFK